MFNKRFLKGLVLHSALVLHDLRHDNLRLERILGYVTGEFMHPLVGFFVGEHFHADFNAFDNLLFFKGRSWRGFRLELSLLGARDVLGHLRALGGISLKVHQEIRLLDVDDITDVFDQLHEGLLLQLHEFLHASAVSCVVLPLQAVSSFRIETLLRLGKSVLNLYSDEVEEVQELERLKHSPVSFCDFVKLLTYKFLADILSRDLVFRVLRVV